MHPTALTKENYFSIHAYLRRRGSKCAYVIYGCPLNLERTLTKFLMDVKHLIEMKGKLKTKRYNTMVNSIDSKNIGKNLDFLF